ncbi:uncharacterized protein (DUF305 family) [Saccharothrix carnea]|uniref:Uncharacterized protein (DUF305 family) n=1 Tax=Saccharothrix carnea TaxID=1280637 RepID=A0A2P8IJ14_SACCR|nr:DUF305 domain-containing protein [Saccharothrix carnea]PSL58470.1 uncharacterized protein (DUF305 family) [Saccharothrix carnea]
MTDPSETTPRRSNLAWAVVSTTAVLAILLLGAAVGLLIKIPGSDSSPAAPGADSVEVGFSQDMAMHHLQAVQMANIARDRSADEKIRSFAFDVSSTQLEQVGRMKGWLMLWGQPEQPMAGKHMAWMAEDGGHGHGATGAAVPSGNPMPGMASSEELARLRSLSGVEFDVYFLQLMLRHHQGGTAMVQYAVDHAGQHAVRTLAESMLKSQSSESDLMRRLISERGAEPLAR